MSYIEVHPWGGWAILGGLRMQHAVHERYLYANSETCNNYVKLASCEFAARLLFRMLRRELL